ncbi:hypothetical protein CRG98_044140 [Punica granatum]|uniref:Leucine-rich repeat-containing N-terminal plant-type domain-containing protein n=1 Tax=Punica granatum TaxID=22663 RepID=A0A2I0HUT8_PUNGR|nr:hypothetical protein CRG98_044140 [Punica granatum]
MADELDTVYSSTREWVDVGCDSNRSSASPEPTSWAPFPNQILLSPRLNWTVSSFTCEWVGVDCNSNRSSVLTLYLHGADLMGLTPQHHRPARVSCISFSVGDDNAVASSNGHPRLYCSCFVYDCNSIELLAGGIGANPGQTGPPRLHQPDPSLPPPQLDRLLLTCEWIGVGYDSNWSSVLCLHLPGADIMDPIPPTPSASSPSSGSSVSAPTTYPVKSPMTSPTSPCFAIRASNLGVQNHN